MRKLIKESVKIKSAYSSMVELWKENIVDIDILITSMDGDISQVESLLCQKLNLAEMYYYQTIKLGTQSKLYEL